MSRDRQWNATKKTVAGDETLLNLARHIRWHNRTYRAIDKGAWMAFQDRVMELNCYVPKGYMTIVLDICMFRIGADQ